MAVPYVSHSTQGLGYSCAIVLAAVHAMIAWPDGNELSKPLV